MRCFQCRDGAHALWISGVLLCAVAIQPAFSQSVSVEHQFSAQQEFYAAEDSVPLWLHANRFGTVPDDSWSTITSGSYGIVGTMGDDLRFDATVGVAGVIEDAGVYAQLQRGDLAFGWRFLELRGGVFPSTRGFVAFPELSSGSLSISGNAAPIPLIQLTTPEFVGLPFTGDMVSVFGGISHGWFTGDRYVDDILLHEKWAYLGLGNDESPIRLYGGLIHQVMWAGESVFLSEGSQPGSASWENYWRVFFNDSGGDDSPDTDQANKIGNAVGTYDLGFTVDIGGATLHAYHQHFFEDGSGRRWRNGVDGLYGVGLESRRPLIGFPNRFIYERIITTYQSGEFHDLTVNGSTIGLGGRDSYYHNSCLSKRLVPPESYSRDTAFCSQR